MELAAPVRPDGSSHAVGLAAVVVVHLVVGYALLTGLAQKVVEAVRAPIEARLIEEIKPPPPPPKPLPVVPPPKRAAPPPPFVPPPEVRVSAPPPAPTIAAVTPTPPPAPVEIRPEPPPAPVVAAAPPPPRPEAVSIGVACPTMVKPVLPRRAEQEGLGGVVRAQATIRGGKVVQVDILSSKPRGLFDAAVRNAMLQYGCQATGGEEVVAQQTFEFRAPE